jgi:hypothetical protein
MRNIELVNIIPISFKVAENGYMQWLRDPRSVPVELIMKFVICQNSTGRSF